MITLIIILIFLGVALWLIETLIPMSDPIRTIIRVVVVLFSLLLILRAFGILDIPVNVR